MAIHPEHDTPDLESLRDQAVAQGDGAVLSAVTQNTELLQRLFERLHQNSAAIEPETAFDEFDNLDFRAVDDNALEAVDENIRLRDENSRLNQLIDRLENEVASLSKDNHDLASKVVYEVRDGRDSEGTATDEATSDSTYSSSADSGASLSWEDRKLQIIEQLENDAFDAEVFLTTLDIKRDDGESSDDVQDAIDYVIDLNAELEQLRTLAKQNKIQIARDIDEIKALKDSRQQLEEIIRDIIRAHSSTDPDAPSEVAEEQTTVDPLNVILDTDEAICEERERLTQLQEHCEQKLREIEIETSLERARLSRERSELEQKNKELEAQVDALQRSIGMRENGNIGTRWMAKLGLTSEGKE